MKTKKILYWSIPLIVLTILFSIKFNTNIYLSFEGGEELFSVNITAKVDNIVIYESINVAPEWSGINVKLEKVPLRMGFHKVEAFSESENIAYKKTVFILFNNYIMITYWEGRENFTVRTGFNPFRFE